MNKNIKPLGHKAYGSIPHLPYSRLGPGDHHIGQGQAEIATKKARDKNDLIIVQEKLDGSNCSVAKINGKIIALGRSGYLAVSTNTCWVFQKKLLTCDHVNKIRNRE